MKLLTHNRTQSRSLNNLNFLEEIHQLSSFDYHVFSFSSFHRTNRFILVQILSLYDGFHMLRKRSCLKPTGEFINVYAWTLTITARYFLHFLPLSIEIDQTWTIECKNLKSKFIIESMLSILVLDKSTSMSIKQLRTDDFLFHTYRFTEILF